MKKPYYNPILSVNRGSCYSNRVISLLLSFALLISMLPRTLLLPVHSVESDAQTYGQYVGWNATLNVVNEETSFVVLDYEPDETFNDSSLIFYMDEFSSDILFRITAYKIVTEVYEAFDENGEIVEKTAQSLWYQVNVIGGTASEDFADGYWILQNYLNAEDAYENDVLTLIEPSSEEETPAYSAPASIVSDGGITVSSDHALFTCLTATEIEAPTAYYINRAVAYDMTPETEDGYYADHAEVTIPIPEGWDSDKVFGFVIEDDGTITALLGTVTKFGTFRFTVPHFSEVGLLEATSVTAVLNKTIVFGKVHSNDTEYVFPLQGQKGETGRFVSDDGAVQYVINHYTSTNAEGNTTTTTYVSLTGLDVTPGTEIIVGDVSIVVIVKALTATVNKLLTGGSVTNSADLDPLYDVGISGSFDIDYTIAEGEECLALSDNTITAVAGKTGSATVVAEIKHPTSNNVVGHVTYDVTVTDVEVTDVKRIYVPQGKTVTITAFSGELSAAVNIDETIATATYDSGTSTLTLTGVADTGETSVIVGNTLLVIYAEPASSVSWPTTYFWLRIDSNDNCTVYYAINGGTLHKLDSNASDANNNNDNVLLIGIDNATHQPFVNGFSLLVFGAPDEGYVTSQITAGGSQNQFYSLSNGSRYDGSDSDAWPLTDPNALTIDGGPKTDAQGNTHGLYGVLNAGLLTVADLRDLFTRALALGCDSALVFSRYNSDKLASNMTFTAEALPTFEKTIVAIKRASDNSIESFDENVPYDPAVHDPLEIGDTVTYQFAINVTSTNITYDFTISDPSIGYNETIAGINSAGTHTYEATYVIGKTDGAVDEDKIKLYANGEFINTASLSYTYQSSAASGQTETVSTSSVTCRINSIVTWKDNFGTVWSVQTLTQGTDLPKIADAAKIGYSFGGWDYEAAVDAGYLQVADDFYKIASNSTTSFTIEGTLTRNSYTITYVPNGGTLPDGVSESATYTIEDLLTLPTPTMAGKDFSGWLVTTPDGNWPENSLYAGDQILMHRYGNVTLTAQWGLKTYTVTWVAEDGTTVLETDYDVPHGTMPHYDGALPTKEPETRYTFSWSPAITTVTADVTYIAQFDDALGDDHKVYIGINIAYHQPNSTYNYNDGTGRIDGNSYHAFPAEPHTLHDILLWRAHLSDGAWEIDEDWDNSLGTPSAYIVASIFDDPNFTVNATASGIFDPTGELVKEYFNLSDADYEAIIQTWLSPTFAGPNTDINWGKVSEDDCAIVPYVIKLQDNGNWYIDMVIVVQETPLTIEVEDNQDGNTNQTFLFKITAENHAGFELLVVVREGNAVTVDGLFPGKTYIIEELTGWSWKYGDSPGWEFTTDGDTDALGSGGSAEIVLGTTGNEITFTNDLDDPGWLGGEGSKDNEFTDP